MQRGWLVGGTIGGGAGWEGVDERKRMKSVRYQSETSIYQLAVVIHRPKEIQKSGACKIAIPYMYSVARADHPVTVKTISQE